MCNTAATEVVNDDKIFSLDLLSTKNGRYGIYSNQSIVDKEGIDNEDIVDREDDIYSKTIATFNISPTSHPSHDRQYVTGKLGEHDIIDDETL